MSGRTELVSLPDAREQAIARLSDAFAEDRIGLEELETRLTLAHRAVSVADVEHVLSDLATAPAPSAALTIGARDAILAVFGGVERGGPWARPRRLQALAVFGGIVLDLREARFLPGVTDLYVVAVMGGAQVIVPPGLSVEVSGTAILGGFAHIDRRPVRLDPELPLLRVQGCSILGGVAVETRLPAESEIEAHRRRHYRRPALGRCE